MLSSPSAPPIRPRAKRGLSFRPLALPDLELVFNRHNRAFGREWLRRQALGEVYVAVACLDGLPVGRAGLDFVRVRRPETAYLWAAHVEPRYQSQGIGTALLIHLEQVARERGLLAVTLAVAKDNPRAQTLYERLGYAVFGDKVLSWAYLDDAGQKVVVEEDSWLLLKPLLRTSESGLESEKTADWSSPALHGE